MQSHITHFCNYKNVKYIIYKSNKWKKSKTHSKDGHVDKNHILFARNNIIIDVVDRFTYNPHEEICHDESNNILQKNKELAMAYCIIIIFTIGYIVIIDWMSTYDDENI